MSALVLDAEASGPPPSEIPLESLSYFDGPARDRPLLLAGDRAAALGEEASGIREILLHPIRAVSGLRTGLPGAERVRVSAGAAHRHVNVGGRDVLEAILVFRRLPGVVVRWSRESGGSEDRPLELGLSWDCSGAEAPTGGMGLSEDGLLRLPLADRPEELLFAHRGGPCRWRVEESGTGGEAGLRVGLRSTVAPDRSTALLVTLVRDGGTEARAVLSRLGRLSAEVTGWAEAADRDERNGLVLDASEGPLGPALAWARRRLPAALVHPGGHRPGRVVSGYGNGCSPGARTGEPPGRSTNDGLPRAPLSEIPWIGHGFLAAGRHEEALEVVARGLERLAGADGRASTGQGSVGEASLILQLGARCVLWTGDARPLRERRDSIDAALERIGDGLDEEIGRSEVVAAAAAYRDLADAMEAGGSPGRADRLRQCWESLRDRLASAPSMARGDLGLDPGVLAAVLDTPGPELRADAGPAEPSGGPDAGLRAWARWARGDSEEALRYWRKHLVAGTRGRPGLWGLGPEAAAGRGMDGRSGSGCPWHSATTALILAPLAFGFLGARADAAYGRLRLAPRVPAEWRRFEIRGLRVGDVRVRLDYRRNGRRHTFVVAPTAGRIPLNVVFEPILPEGAIEGVRVGGEPAEVDVYRHRDRTGIRLQLPLDSRREIAVDGAGRQD